MLFTGTLQIPKTHTSALQSCPLTRLVPLLEAQEYEVQHTGKELFVRLPGADRAFLKLLNRLPMPMQTSTWEDCARTLWDKMGLSVTSDGSILYRLHYWVLPQWILHGLINFFILSECLMYSGEHDLKQLLIILFLGNVLPILMSHVNAYLFLRTLIKTLTPKASSEIL